MRAALRNFGLKMGQVSRPKRAARARELAEGVPASEVVVDALLRVRDALLQELRALDRKLLEAAKSDPTVRTLMTAPGVGAIVALAFKSAVDDPDRLRQAKDVGPWLGLTPSRYQSGRTDHVGRIMRAGDAGVRTALYEAATTLLGRVTRWSALKSWGGGALRGVAGPRRLASPWRASARSPCSACGRPAHRSVGRPRRQRPQPRSDTSRAPTPRRGSKAASEVPSRDEGETSSHLPPLPPSTR
jgi:transposase